MLTELFANTVRMLSGAETPDNWFADWARGGEVSSSGEYINEENALNCSAMKSAVGILCETVASLPIEIVREEKSGSKTLILDHPVHELLSHVPNPETSRYSWKHKLQQDACTYGNAYAWIERGITSKKTGTSFDPVALWQRSPKPSRTAMIRRNGKLWYEVRDEYGNTEDPIPADDMLHIPYLSPDGLIGKSPVKVIREAIGGNKAAERYANEMFKNGGTPQGYFRYPSKISQPAYERLKTSIGEQSQHGGRHKTSILEEGGDFLAVSLNPQETQMIEARRFLVEEIARAYRIALYLMQVLDAGSTPDITELGRQFITYTMKPWFEMWTAEIDRKLLKPPFKSRFNPVAFLLGDYVQMATYIRAGFSVGGLSVNDVRNTLGMNPLVDKNADEYWIPLNMVPLSKADQQQKPAPSGEKPGGVHPGDGILPKEPDPSKETDGNLATVQAAEAVLADAIRRMGRVEANAATRAAKDPATFQGTIETFLTKHATTFREAVSLPLRAVLACGGDWVGEDELVRSHVNGVRAMLLAASECKTSELYERVAAVVADRGK